MQESLILLPPIIRPKGTGIPGLTATLVKRTEKVAWYVRNDGYHEVFQIKIGRSFDGTTRMEYYPGNEDIGRIGICTRYAETAAQHFDDLCLGEPINELQVPD